MLKKWDDLPVCMRTEAVRPYYDYLKKRQVSIFFKRIFDILASMILLVFFSPIILFISIAILLDSEGEIFFRQERVTQYGRKFRIYKFRTMVANAEKLGTQVTTADDSRITKIGKKLRKRRLDELPQLIDILLGNMTFVGTRPEATKYVKSYTPEMMATLLLPAGVTSEASLKYKDEDAILAGADDVDSTYINVILPEKMKYNLKSIKNFSLLQELCIIARTALVIIR